MLKVSASGQIERDIALGSFGGPTGPACIRVHPQTGLLWVGGWLDTGVVVLDADGHVIETIDNVGPGIAIDGQDGSVWVTSGRGLDHYSANGALLAAGIGDDTPWNFVALFPHMDPLSHWSTSLPQAVSP
jgi:hypothetical protein